MSSRSINEELKRLIESATTGATAGGPRITKTRMILNHLDQIEEALQRGIGRAALAQVFGWSLGEFDSGLYRARRMHRAGGDQRLKADPPTAETPAETQGNKTTNSPTPTNSLRKPL
ncbi:hypothetical protein [Sedimenticola hydrogenitrophicus]|uniref:hypothetical protein n=1 Tax=Sedimenticola hydrogenitrophicus TaxID=2967975 RepID=UPI0023AF4913|nr:hypothetical protein [Sedimenticola hydrogenitrophicus]